MDGPNELLGMAVRERNLGDVAGASNGIASGVSSRRIRRSVQLFIGPSISPGGYLR
jgi:hypothetical protein